MKWILWFVVRRNDRGHSKLNSERNIKDADKLWKCLQGKQKSFQVSLVRSWPTFWSFKAEIPKQSSAGWVLQVRDDKYFILILFPPPFHCLPRPKFKFLYFLCVCSFLKRKSKTEPCLSGTGCHSCLQLLTHLKLLSKALRRCHYLLHCCNISSGW